MQTLSQLFVSFALVGLGAYGGGLVTIPLIQHEIVTVRGWLSFDEMASLLAVAQMTPGPIAVNGATFVGFRIAGFAGSAVATLAVVLPSLLVLALIVPFVDRIIGDPRSRRFREGIHLGVLALVLFAAWTFGAGAVKGLLELAVGVAAFMALVAFEGKLHPVFVILAGGVLGLLLL